MEKGSKFKKTFSNSQENYISSCQGLSLFGGYKVTQKSGDSYKGIFVNYQNLEPHEEITVRFNFYMIDTWDSKDTL